MDSQNPNSIEDIFGSSLNLEDTHFSEGYTEGYNDGLASAKEEGRQVGLKSGFQVGEELGFYQGCVDVWRSAIELDSTCFSSRVQKIIKQMDELVRKYPISEPENESVTDVMDSLRLKFRAICATLNVKLEYNGYPKASQPNEISVLILCTSKPNKCRSSFGAANGNTILEEEQILFNIFQRLLICQMCSSALKDLATGPHRFGSQVDLQLRCHYGTGYDGFNLLFSKNFFNAILSPK